jgi:hypothetical protein
MQEVLRNLTFYCSLCFADKESDCYCDWLVGYDSETGLPIVSISEKGPAIPKVIIRRLASIEDRNRAAIEAEGYSEEFGFPLELIDSLVEAIKHGKRKQRQENRRSF